MFFRLIPNLVYEDNLDLIQSKPEKLGLDQDRFKSAEILANPA